ncbi:MAG: D-glycero-alpha-D-manno-heptose-1,7-bisphosphate 7-phosphatase [Bacteroidales bacterium]
MTLKSLETSKRWTLFLDRDGVINRRLINDYVKTWEEFDFIRGVPGAVSLLSKVFGKVLVVTNQQGIGKGLMSMADLEAIHRNMLDEINAAGGRIDKIYVCPDLEALRPFCRKPRVGMGLQAKIDFPEISFKHSVMCGDSESDMRFGKRLKMKTVLIHPKNTIALGHPRLVDFWFTSLKDFAMAVDGEKD